MFALEFFVPGKVKGKARPRFTRNGHTYTPESTRSYEHLIKTYAQIAMEGRLPVESAVEVKITATFEPAKSARKSDRLEMVSKALPVLKKPDADNIIKAVLDAMNNTVFVDDTQVSGVSCRKVYGESEGITVRVISL